MIKPMRITIDVVINPDQTIASGFNTVRIGTEETFSESLVVDVKNKSWSTLIHEVSRPTFNYIKTIPGINSINSLNDSNKKQTLF